MAYPKKPPISSLPSELNEQIKLCVALDRLGLLYYSVPNGGKRNYMEAANLKRSGVKAGVPDICILQAIEPYHGLYIELKRQRGGVVSEAQHFWLEALRARGYKAVVCKGADEAISAVESYLRGALC